MTRILLLAALTLACSGPVYAGSPGRGLELSKTCQACHGVDGNGVGDPQYPIIAGQYPDYLEFAMKAYRSGERDNAIMLGFSQGLSDQDIADLAAYFGSQKSKLTDLSKRK